MNWPKSHIEWIEGKTLFVSIPFTWNLPEVKRRLSWRSKAWHSAMVGGPAIDLMPDYFEGMGHVLIGSNLPGVLQRVNPMATRTTIGCVRKCSFCAIGTGAVEPGGLKCLDDWPDLPIICDNNLLAAPRYHFDKVIDRLVKWGWADFNQGLDARLLTERHAKRIAEIKKPMIRLALDSFDDRHDWVNAFIRLRDAGIAKSNIRSYALVGFNSGPAESWERCKWVESHGIKVLPMWFHELDCLQKNEVTKKQRDLGWGNYERQRLMGWFYKHRDKGPKIENKQNQLFN